MMIRKLKKAPKIIGASYMTSNENKPGKLILVFKRINISAVINCSYIKISRGDDNSFKMRSFEEILMMTKISKDTAGLDMGNNIICLPMPVVLQPKDKLEISHLVEGKFHKYCLTIK